MVSLFVSRTVCHTFFSPLLAQLLDGPLLLAEWAPVVLLDPQAHAAVVKGVVALAPHHDTILASDRALGVHFRLALAAQACVHYLEKRDQYKDIFDQNNLKVT